MVLGGLLLIGAVPGGLWWVQNGGARGKGELIAAQDGDYKVAPKNDGAKTFEGGGGCELLRKRRRRACGQGRSDADARRARRDAAGARGCGKEGSGRQDCGCESHEGRARRQGESRTRRDVGPVCRSRREGRYRQRAAR